MVKINLVRQLLAFLKKYLWIKPTSKEKPLKATDVINNFVCINYKGQWINLHKDQIANWNSAPRKKKRETALRTAKDVKQGKIRFVDINGKMTCIKNKDYGKDNGQLGEGRT